MKFQERVVHFWIWMAAHQTRLDSMESTDSPVWDELLAQVKTLHKKLWFEVSVPSPEGREFVLTAQGEVALFPLVEQAIAQAPALPGWTFVALKQPMGFDFGMRYEGVEIVPSNMWFEPFADEEHPDVLGVRIACPGYTKKLKRPYHNGVLVMLDSALGERSAAQDVELIEVCAPPADPDEEGYLPLAELADYIQWRKTGRALH